MSTSVKRIVGRAVARAPGTCGELAQGMVDGEHFLITCPIDIYSTATVELVEGSGKVFGPENCPKSRRAAELTLEYLQSSAVDVHFTLASSLPRGKGMASSTADVSAAMQATALALGFHMSPAEVAEIALRVEPSDGVMFPGITLFDHREGKTAKNLGCAPPIRVLVLDFGGRVDTLEFNGTDRSEALRRMEPELRRSIDLISEGVRRKDARMIGEGATISALSHQKVLFKAQLDEVLDLSSELEAVGVNVAHSGTVIGMLFDGGYTEIERAISETRRRFPDIQRVIQTRLVGGGVVQASESG